MGDGDCGGTTIRILFPMGISYADVPLDSTKTKQTCEDVKLFCLEKLRAPNLLSDAAVDENDKEDLVDIRPAFGLVKAGNESVWLSPNHVFEENNKKQVYKFRLRHRPPSKLYGAPSSKLSVEHKLLSEFFVLQALDDFLKGELGKAMVTEVKREIIIKLALYALLLPSSLPLQNSEVIDDRFKLKNFKLFNYQKRFSKELYNAIVGSSSKYNRLLDHYFYHKGLCDTLRAHKSQNKRVEFYKKEFVNILLESYPSYCFERYSAVDSDNYLKVDVTDKYLKVDVNLVLYEESTNNGRTPGLYVNEARHCGLDDVDRIFLKGHDATEDKKQQWEVEICCSGPKSQDKCLLFDDEETAASFITMLQGYITLCIRPDLIICRRFTSPSVEVKNRLKSFCPMTQSRAVELLCNENQHKAKNEWCKFMIYESMSGNREEEGLFKVITDDPDAAAVRNIRHLNGKGFLLYSPSESEEFTDHMALRNHLKNHYGQQLRPDLVIQKIYPESIFCVEKTQTNQSLSFGDMTEDWNRTPGYILEEDVGPEIGLIENSDDEHVRRSIVQIGEDKRVLVQLVPEKRYFIEAMYAGMSKMARMYRLHPASVRGFYGPVFAPTFCQSYVLEHTTYGNLVQFMQRNNKYLSTYQKMKLALEVVNIVCTLIQQQSFTSHLLHGNLRGTNFCVFRQRDSYYLKLGDPGLVSYYNTLSLDKAINAEREPWLSPERQQRLKEVTVASEIYAVATTIAEIFHGAKDFKIVLAEAENSNVESGDESDGVPRSDQPGDQNNGVPRSDQPGEESNGVPRSDQPGEESNGVPRSDQPGEESNGVPRSDQLGEESNGVPRSDQPGEESNGVPRSDQTNELNFRIPRPKFETSGDEAVVHTVKVVITELWNCLGQCWSHEPESRPHPMELKNQLYKLSEDASFIKEETGFEFLKAAVSILQQTPGCSVQNRIQNLSTKADCDEFLQDHNNFYIPIDKLTNLSSNSRNSHGRFGDVSILKLNYRHHQKLVAVKVNKQVKDVNFFITFTKEFNLCAKLTHPNIVSAFAWSIQRDGRHCMIMDLMNSGTLLAFAQKRKDMLKDNKQIRIHLELCMDVAKGLEYCETERVVHCDLAARNVLLNVENGGTLVAKVADFGLSKILNRGNSFYYEQNVMYKERPIFSYPPEYLAYEKDGVQSTGIDFTTKGDVWAYGTTLWELFSGGQRVSAGFPNMPDQNKPQYLYDFYMEDRKRLPKTDLMRDDIYNLMMMCWNVDKLKRPEYAKIRETITSLQLRYK